MNKKNIKEMNSLLAEKNLTELAEMLKSIAHPLRMRIVDILVSNGPKTVGELAEITEQNQSVISQQLKILRLNKQITRTRDGSFHIYEINNPNLKNMMRCLEGCQKFIESS